MIGALTRNVRRTRGWCVLGALAALASSACNVSQSEERELGAEEAAQVDSELPLVGDTTVTRFISALGHSLASRTSRADLEWRFAVVNTDDVNAFALPGGFVYVNRGLIEQSDRLDELAGVMGHEIGHVVRRHSVKQIEETGKRDVGLVLLCTLTDACRGVGGRIAVRVGADAMAAQYSQHDEAQADSEGVIIVRRAGIDPEGLPAFFEKLMAQRTEEPTPIDAFFSTHPTDERRIATVRRQIAALGAPRGETLVRDTPEFQAIRERVRALPPPPSDSAVAQRRAHVVAGRGQR
ncbi:MAG TPA: M48 family metallopeptidase [Gemmatimonadaceae bacterium]|nr:M48 family metallopeptidase [Gemmatimonadaceae bacterium]